jgi:hypothetical protein
MKNIILFVFLFPSLLLFSQVKKKHLAGEWINTHTEMKDGSTLLKLVKEHNSYSYLNFKSKHYITRNQAGDLENNMVIKYQLKNHFIISSKYFKYVIEKITSDSLVLLESMTKVNDDKLKRYYFVKEQTLKEIEERKNIQSKDLIANSYYSPKFDKNIHRYLNNSIKGYYQNLKLKGNLTLYLLEKKIKTKFTHSSLKNVTILEKILKESLENSYQYWSLKDFKKFETIEVSFVIKIEKTKSFKGLNIKLFTNSFNDLKADYGQNLKNITKSDEYFNLGLHALKEKKYRNASTFFLISYNSNILNIDALYNRAASLYKDKQIIRACSVWSKIKNLGQVQGQEIYRTHCLNLKH